MAWVPQCTRWSYHLTSHNMSVQLCYKQHFSLDKRKYKESYHETWQSESSKCSKINPSAFTIMNKSFYFSANLKNMENNNYYCSSKFSHIQKKKKLYIDTIDFYHTRKTLNDIKYLVQNKYYKSYQPEYQCKLHNKRKYNNSLVETSPVLQAQCGNILPNLNMSTLLTWKQKHAKKSQLSQSLTSQKRSLHTSCRNTANNEVPDYLIDNISEVESLENEEDLQDLQNPENEMEEEISQFLNCRAIVYDEADNSFIMQCPTCSDGTERATTQDLFVDKHSGYYVCPHCCGAGKWEELCTLLDSRVDVLTPEQLKQHLHATEPLTSATVKLLRYSSCKSLSLETAGRYGCLLSRDHTCLIVPVWRRRRGGSEAVENAWEAVGYHSVCVLHPAPQVVSRFLPGQTSIWSSLNTSENINKVPQNLVVVSNICEALHLAEHGIAVMTAAVNVDSSTDASADTSTSTGTVTDIAPSVRHVVLWLPQGTTLPYSFYTHLIERNISCSAVRPEDGLPLSAHGRVVSERLQQKKLLPLLSDKITSFASLQDLIYYRITHRDEVCGVGWQRFSALGKLLLGHRRGELTVLSGHTGTGKTTFMSEYSLDLAMQGVTTVWASLEVSVVRLCEVMLQQYSGNVLPTDRVLFNALASNFSQLPLYFLDLHGQQHVPDVIKVLQECAVVRGVQHVVVDNLQFLVGSQHTSAERWVVQDQAVSAFRMFATTYNCHVTLIVHPRKLAHGELLTMQTVGGGARVTQEADNVLLLQCTQGRAPQQMRKVIQVAKNRYGGHLGVVPLRFHQASQTLSDWFNHGSGSGHSSVSGSARGSVDGGDADETFDRCTALSHEAEEELPFSKQRGDCKPSEKIVKSKNFTTDFRRMID